jgi:hypothetical protein
MKYVVLHVYSGGHYFVTSTRHRPWSAQRGEEFSDLDNCAADAAFLELTTFPARDRNEEQRELFELPYACPLRGVVAAWACSNLTWAEVLPFDAITEEEEHLASIEGFVATDDHLRTGAIHRPRIADESAVFGIAIAAALGFAITGTRDTDDG